MTQEEEVRKIIKEFPNSKTNMAYRLGINDILTKVNEINNPYSSGEFGYPIQPEYDCFKRAITTVKKLIEVRKEGINGK